MNKTTLNSQKEKHSTLSLRRATKERKVLIADVYIFRSTLSLRRATRSRGSPRILVRDFYPRSPCGERLAVFFLDLVALAISIHALLAESDVTVSTLKILAILFLSTLSLRRATCQRSARKCPDGKFLSTLSLRRATLHALHLAYVQQHFYPRSPCGERPREVDFVTRFGKFLSTLSLRRATGSVGELYLSKLISIHALLAESDWRSFSLIL